MKETNKKRIYLSAPHMGGRERAYVEEAFDSNWIAPLGPHVDGMEKDLCEYTGVGHAAALSSGTAAIHLALILLGVGPEDEVLCSSFTFSASANPILYQGAQPVFVDSESDTWNISPELLEKAILDRREKTGKVPKALILVHLYGMPAKMDAILRICKTYSIPLVEDAAEALGSAYKGKKLGSFGDLSIFSFNGNKIITTSGGGALLSDRKEWIEKARFLATQARDPAPHYQHSALGFNYRMSNVLAGIGRGQMEVIDQRVEQRRRVFFNYKNALENLPGISFLNEPDGFFSNRWLSSILIDPKQANGATRERIRLMLEKENIESRPLWKPMHLQPLFEHYPFYGDGTSEDLFEGGLCLPSGSDLDKETQKRIIKLVKKAL